ncbi:LCP family protein [Actinacidiphila acidipaludis]|uniref:LCP family protein n=1 Tax=Actinacidiphila acidipaludis TaxID=2873382 RepID=A0ABS7Q210_9ACTN|nr:LCP family protein [Streptomyces acidipaludis]MBY8876916.1 LCP family protein [Streptomyces acidipaludis]
MDTQGPEAVDPADQWVLDPVTGEYQLRMDPPAPAPERYPATPGSGGHADGTAASSSPQAAFAEAPFAEAPFTEQPFTGGPAAGPAPATSGSGAAPAPGGRAAARRGGRRAAPNSGRRKPKTRASGSRGVVLGAGALGLALVVGGVGFAVAQRGSGGSGVHTVDVGQAAAATLSTSGPLNVLLIGTTGQGTAGQSGGAAGQADSAVLLHLSADRGNATALTIPGDLVTAIPDCPVGPQTGTAKVVPATPVKGASPTFRQSMGVDGRGAACTMRLVDLLTGVKVDHVVLADAAAVQQLTTAAGGVQVCLKDPLSDPAAHLDLPAGQHRLTAAQAPAFLTTRSAPPGNSAVDRARLQQAYLAALLRQSRAGGAAAKALPDAAARSLTVDPALGSTRALGELAAEIGKVDLRHITFATVPVASGSSGGAVTLDAPAAKQVFSLISRDISLSAPPAAPDPRLTGPKATPHNTRVTVLNGTGSFGASQDVLLWLQNDKGVNRSANGGDARATLATTRLDYAPNQADQARSLAAIMGLPASALHEGAKNVPALTYMTLTLGKDYTAPGTPIALPSTPPRNLALTTADSTACVG